MNDRHYRILRSLERDPQVSQRRLAEEKSRNTVRFLQRKTAEYEALRKEVGRLRREAMQR